MDEISTVVRQQLTSLLGPFNECLADLQLRARDMGNTLAVMDKELREHKASFLLCQQDVQGLQAGAAASNARFDRTKAELTGTNDELHRLMSNYEGTKTLVEEMADRERAHNALSQDLMKKYADNESMCRALKLGLLKTDKQLNSLNEGVEAFKRQHQELEDLHHGAAAEIQHLQDFSEQTKRNLDALSKACEQLKEEDVKAAAHDADMMSSVKKLIFETNRDLEKHRESLRAYGADLEQVKMELEHEHSTFNFMDNMKKWQMEANKTLRDHDDHLKRVDGTLEGLGNSTVAERLRTGNAVSDLQRRMEQTTGDVHALLAAEKKVQEDKRRTAELTERMQAAQRRMEEESGLHGQDIKNLLTWQKAAANAIEIQMVEGAKAKEELGQQGNQVEEAVHAVHDLQEEVIGLKRKMANLNNRVGGMKQGVDAGFQDAIKMFSPGSPASPLSPSRARDVKPPPQAWDMTNKEALPDIAVLTPRNKMTSRPNSAKRALHPVSGA